MLNIIANGSAISSTFCKNLHVNQSSPGALPSVSLLILDYPFLSKKRHQVLGK